jgi:hypothetical protein
LDLSYNRIASIGEPETLVLFAYLQLRMLNLNGNGVRITLTENQLHVGDDHDGQVDGNDSSSDRTDHSIAQTLSFSKQEIPYNIMTLAPAQLPVGSLVREHLYLGYACAVYRWVRWLVRLYLL